ncbi:hypothetical protein DFH06DRAFT_1123463 [Mycena polygramma]|nr:hypothetical protein DFH06DRAFT_1123463 [Mycena polygramma]
MQAVSRGDCVDAKYNLCKFGKTPERKRATSAPSGGNRRVPQSQRGKPALDAGECAEYFEGNPRNNFATWSTGTQAKCHDTWPRNSNPRSNPQGDSSHSVIACRLHGHILPTKADVYATQEKGGTNGAQNAVESRELLYGEQAFEQGLCARALVRAVAAAASFADNFICARAGNVGPTSTAGANAANSSIQRQFKVARVPRWLSEDESISRIVSDSMRFKVWTNIESVCCIAAGEVPGPNGNLYISAWVKRGHFIGREVISGKWRGVKKSRVRWIAIWVIEGARRKRQI